MREIVDNRRRPSDLLDIAEEGYVGVRERLAGHSSVVEMGGNAVRKAGDVGALAWSLFRLRQLRRVASVVHAETSGILDDYLPESTAATSCVTINEDSALCLTVHADGSYQYDYDEARQERSTRYVFDNGGRLEGVSRCYGDAWGVDGPYSEVDGITELRELKGMMHDTTPEGNYVLCELAVGLVPQQSDA